jgi:hypothetical protein
VPEHRRFERAVHRLRAIRQIREAGFIDEGAALLVEDQRVTDPRDPTNLIKTDPLRLVDRATLARRLDDILEGAPTQPSGP